MITTDQDDRHQHEGERRRRRVVGLFEVERLDHVADHLVARAAEELGVDVVAGGGDEGQQGAGDDPRRRERQRHPPEGLRRARVEVLGGLDQAHVEPLEAGVERQHHERQEVVGEAGDHRRAGGEDVAAGGQADRLQHAHHRAVVGEDRLPGEGPDQVGGEERGHHREQHRVAPAPRLEGDRVGQRVAERQRERGREPRVDEGAHELGVVERERIGVVGPVPVEVEAAEGTRVQRQLPHVVQGDYEEEDQPDRPRHKQEIGDGPAPHAATR